MQQAFRYSRFLFYTALLQGVYYVITGIWPLLHLVSFIWVTGPKYDTWLVKTVGVLILVQGGVILSAAFYKRISKEIIVLSIGAAAGLMGIDVYYAFIDRIWNVYFLDAVAEAGLIILWLIAWSKAAEHKT
jgi:hypothetical protein